MAETTSETAGAPGEHREHEAAPTRVVERFLELLRRSDVDRAVELLAEDVEYVNVGLPAIHGRERVRRAFRATLGRSRSGFDVYIHAITADGPTVLTERTDVLIVRRARIQLWVCGRFDVHDGKIVLWRDYFDYATVLAATARGLIGALLPSVQAAPPLDARHDASRP